MLARWALPAPLRGVRANPAGKISGGDDRAFLKPLFAASLVVPLAAMTLRLAF